MALSVCHFQAWLPNPLNKLHHFPAPSLLQLCSSSTTTSRLLSLPRQHTSPPASPSPGGLFACHAPAAKLSGSPVHLLLASSLPVPELRSCITGLPAEQRALMMGTSSRACSTLLTRVRGFLELLHARSLLLSSSSSCPECNYVKRIEC